MRYMKEGNYKFLEDLISLKVVPLMTIILVFCAVGCDEQSLQFFFRFSTLGNKLQIFEILSSTSFVEWNWCSLVKK